MASLVLALRFLTILPVPGREAGGPGALGRAAWWFAAVGLILGTILVAADWLMALAFPPLLSALLVVSLWKILTGGIHLDGLADCLDGLGGGDRQRRLAIMRDSRIGVFGAVGLILLFLIATMAVAEMPAPSRRRVLLLAPVVGRLAPVLIGARFRAATPDQGSGAPFLRGLPGWAGPVNLVATAALGGWLLGSWGFLITLGALAIVSLWSAFLAWRLGGLTGDVLGSGVELGELMVLLGGAALAHLGLG